MLWRYLRSSFLFWFGAIFSAVGLIVFATLLAFARSAQWVLIAGLVFLGSCFFIPGAIVAANQLRRILRSVTALERGRYVVGRVEEIVSADEMVNGVSLHRVAWSWQGPDGKRRRAQSPSMSGSDANHWKRGDEIAAYMHPSDPEFAEADVYGYRQ